MHIGILQCGHTPPVVADLHGDFDALFHRLLGGHDFTFTTWNVVDMEFPSGPEAADGWLVTGSRHGAYEDHAFIAPLEELVLKIYASAKPMVGICFGHQIIAQALGGKVEKFHGGWSMGRETYDFDGIGPITLNAWHQDQVVQIPDDARVLARSEFCENAALVYGNRVLTVQAHPEFSPLVIADYLGARANDPTYPAPLMQKALADAATPVDDGRVGNMLAGFLKRKDITNV